VSSAAGLSLDAQPAAFTDSVRRNGFVSDMKSLYRVAWSVYWLGPKPVVVPSEARDLGFRPQCRSMPAQKKPRSLALLGMTQMKFRLGSLFYCDIGDLDLGILMVPLRGDALKRQAKSFALTGA